MSAPGRRFRAIVGRRALGAGLVLLLAAGAAGLSQAQSGPQAGTLKVTVERLGRFYNAGDPILVRVAVFNTGDTPYDNAKGIDLLGNLVVGEVSGTPGLKRKPSPTAESRLQPAMIPAGGFFGIVADLRDVFEGLDKPGRYSVRFALGDLASDSVPLVLIGRYDPATPYQATLETEYGKIVFDLLGQQVPAHVRNFHDLANQGFYDGSMFHVVVKGIELRGGDSAGDGTTDPGYGLATEIVPTLKHQRGTLSMVRGRSGDHGSQFMISLAENAGADGQLTIFGLMASGDETLAAIENLPTTGRREYPYFRPLKDVTIRTIRVSPAKAGSKASAESGTATEPSGP